MRTDINAIEYLLVIKTDFFLWKFGLWLHISVHLIYRYNSAWNQDDLSSVRKHLFHLVLKYISLQVDPYHKLAFISTYCRFLPKNIKFTPVENRIRLIFFKKPKIKSVYEWKWKISSAYVFRTTLYIKINIW